MTDEGPAPMWRVVAVSGVELEMPSVHPEVLLTEVEAPWRTLRIPVGFAEGSAIAYAWRGLATPRPLTHELLSELLDRHGIDIAALRITARQGSLFLAELETTGPRGRQVLPCRPSDGIAIALRRPLPVPITVAEGLFDAHRSAPAEPSATGPASTQPEASEITPVESATE